MKLPRLALVFPLLFGAVFAASAPALAQLGLPRVSDTVNQTLQTVDRTLTRVDESVQDVAATAGQLATARLERLTRLVRRNGASIERDAAGDPARRGELLLIDPAPGALDAASAAGFTVLSSEQLGELGIAVARLRVPDGLSLARAQAALGKLLPDATISADTLSFQSGGAARTEAATRSGRAARTPAAMPPIATPVGIIDGGTGPAIPVAAARGFAQGAPAASDHGSAVASLLRGAGVQTIMVADVYGRDPAAGNALAIARALDWLAGRKVGVVSISLVGPANPVIGRAVAAAQHRGIVIVAAVGNDGPAAPPSYPASYPGVIAVTAVDGHNRALIEAGHALHLDYAAPGADMLAANATGRWVNVRGTSFATPLAASRAALAAGGDVIGRLNAEAIDLGARGPDPVYGRGLLCAICRRTH